MAIRGIDTQIMATKPAEMSATQSRIQKLNELQMQQTASLNNKDSEIKKDRTEAAAKTEGQRISADEEGGANSGRESSSGKKQEQEQEQKAPFVDPMLSLPVEKGKYAKKQKHYIDLQL